ncbi:MAG TPA: CHASE3 domain-containing protein [Chloroflexia bacterium]|nr:CHASE3 domain-containing protein [Chloroflexia bacterium]
MKNWSFSKMLLGGFGAIVLVLVAIGFILFSYTSSFSETNKLKTHNYEVLNNITLVFSALQDAESSQRGYLLTGDKAYLDPYSSALSNLESQLNKLRTLIEGDSVQQANLARMQPLINAKLAELNNTINLRDNGKQEAALQVVKSGQGQQLMTTIRSITIEMQTYEDNAQKQRTNAQESGNTSVETVVAILIILACLLIFLIYWIITTTTRRWNQTQKALRLSEENFRFLAQNSTDLISRTSPGGKFLYVSPSCRTILGYEPYEILQTSLYDLFHPDDAESLIQNYEGLFKQREIQVSTFRLRHKNGNYIWIESVSRPLPDLRTGQTRELQASSRDVSGRVKTEEEFKKALQQEKELNELKSRFISTASHEFRNPLGTIQTSVELLEYYGDQFNPEKKERIYKRVYHAIEHLQDLLEDILIIGRADAGKLVFKPAPLELVSFCRDLVEEFILNAGKKHHIIFNSNRNQIAGNFDEKLLRHIFSNLLSNAIKYSPEGSTIYFTLDFNPQDNRVVSTIKDQGIGIPEEDQKRLFESFFRAHNVGTIKGTGLGLTIARRNVELHGGEIEVSSHAGEGATFTVRLPLGEGAGERLLEAGS